jgi:phosphopantetheinyl transferase (holo-ACP synthase)
VGKRNGSLWLQNAFVEGDQSLAFEQLQARELETAKAWAFKEAFVEFWSQPDGLRAKLFFGEWYDSVMRSKLEPPKKVARMLQSHLCVHPTG